MLKRSTLMMAVAVLGALMLGLAGCRRGGSGGESGGSSPSEGLYVYSEGCFRNAVEELANEYEKKTGTTIDIDYSGCGELLTKINQTRRGDIYVSHTPFLGALKQRGFLDRGATVAAIEPVILVQKGNPKNIEGLKDLAKDGLRLALPDKEHSTTGHLVTRMLKKSGMGDEIRANLKTRSPEGSGAANAVQIGTVDAAIVWNIFATMRSEKTEAVPIEKEYRMKKADAVTTATYGKIEMDYIRVTAASLNVSNKKEKARDFVRFMAREDNRKVWKKHGYLMPQENRPHPALTDETRIGGGA